MTQQRSIFFVSEAARHLHISTLDAHKAIKAGLLRAIQMDKATRVTLDEILRVRDNIAFRQRVEAQRHAQPSSGLPGRSSSGRY
jgi:hypothetical protein